MLGTGALDATLFSGDPFLIPGLMLVLGLTAALAASLRRRVWAGRGRRAAVVGYGLVAVLSFLVAGGCAFHRAQLFWGLRWEDNRRGRPRPYGRDSSVRASRASALAGASSSTRRRCGAARSVCPRRCSSAPYW